MNLKFATNRKSPRRLANILGIFAILAIAIPVTIMAHAVSSPPFLGTWQATDVDGNEMRLTISGAPNGPFQITWTGSYISLCNREAGIVRGIGQFDESDPNFLAADLHLQCFTSGASLDFHFAWRYHPITRTLSGWDDNGVVTVWHRAGQSQPLPSALQLRVNYGHDWVESFYEGGHMAWITVTESDGVTVKAMSESLTEPKDYWGGESGFQSMDSVWFDAEGNQLETPPDIRPNDWVFGWVDNGAGAQVQIGDISGIIDLAADSVEGTILATWITDPVQVQCLDWGSGGEPFDNREFGSVLANGNEPYSCSWAREWDIQPRQHVGVGYFSPDGHWVANAFVRDGTIIVTSTADVIANDRVCTLREAIISANLNAPSGDLNGECPGGMENETDLILLAANQTYSLTIDSTYEDSAADGDLDIWNNSAATDLIIRVEGNGKATISQNASVDDRVLDNRGATVKVEGLTLTGGSRVGSGSGVLNSGTMDISASTVINNLADWSGGGIFNSNTATLTINSSVVSNNSVINNGGGGIVNEGFLTLTNSTVSGNTANHDGGGIANTGTLIIDSSVMSGNSGKGGGALANWPGGNATIQNGTEVYGNSASTTGGGLFTYSTLMVDSSIVSDNTSEYGAGLANWGGTLTLKNSTVANNSASASAGGIHNKDGGTTTIEKGSVISGNKAVWDGGGVNNWDGTVTLNNSTVFGNTAAQSGGGILNLSAGTVSTDAGTISNNSASDGGGLANWGGTVTLTNTSVSKNTAAWGGGVATYDGTLTLNATTVSGNRANNDAGGIFIKESATVNIKSASVISENTASYGSGMANWSGTLTVDASSIFHNTAANSGGGILNKDGGTAIIQNGSNISGNTANWGGGISNWDGTLTISNSIVSENTANGGGGGLDNRGMLTMNVSVLLGNTSPGEGDAVYSVTDTTNVPTVTSSCVVGNGDTAIFNEGSTSQNFTGNWWGEASGPGGVGPGSGDSISGFIDFYGWLTEPPSICAP